MTFKLCFQDSRGARQLSRSPRQRFDWFNEKFHPIKKREQNENKSFNFSNAPMSMVSNMQTHRRNHFCVQTVSCKHSGYMAARNTFLG